MPRRPTGSTRTLLHRVPGADPSVAARARPGCRERRPGRRCPADGPAASDRARARGDAVGAAASGGPDPRVRPRGAAPEEGRDGFILGGLDVRRGGRPSSCPQARSWRPTPGDPRYAKIVSVNWKTPPRWPSVHVGTTRTRRPPACLLDPVWLLRAHPVVARAVPRLGEAEVLQRRRYILKPPR